MICGGRYQFIPVDTNLGNNALRVKLLECWFQLVSTGTAVKVQNGFRVCSALSGRHFERTMCILREIK